MLESLYDHLKDGQESWEVLIVCDDCRDGTGEVALGWAKERGEDRIRVIKLEKNRGKGGAVTHVGPPLSLPPFDLRDLTQR